MITPRRTRLLRVPDLHGFRKAIVASCTENDATALVVVPTSGAARQLGRTIAASNAPAPIVVTREGLYDLLHARLPGASRRLGAIERDSIIQAAAHAAASALDPTREGRTDGNEGSQVPFQLRPGLIAEMLRFYDQLRRQSQRLSRFTELIEETLGGGSGDRGTDRLHLQTRFLTATFLEYERRASESGGWDEHTLRDRLMHDQIMPVVERVVVTVADWIGEPDGLFVGDFDLLSRMPGLKELDLVCTEAVLESGFHQRLHDWWPGLEEVTLESARVRPQLETPRDAGDQLWFTRRDREDELAAVAQHIRSSERRDGAAVLERVAVVFKRPLPYLYLAAGTLGAAGIPYQASDAMPLAGEPIAAAIDLVLDAVESGFSRDSLTALLRTPHFTADGLEPATVRSFDDALRALGYLGDFARLEELASHWTETVSRPALERAVETARALAPLATQAAASVQLNRLMDFVTARLRPLEGDPFAMRESRARTAVMDVLTALAAAHATHHDPAWTIHDLAAAVRRWIGEHTFSSDEAAIGIHLLDDRAVRYGAFDDVTIVGLVESEWPDRQARNIFYPSGLLRTLGWPSESTRRPASDARFIDLVASSSRRTAISTIVLDDESIVMRSMQLDEIPRARLSNVPSEDDVGRITPEAVLVAETMDPMMLDALPGVVRDWAELRHRRSPQSDSAYHGVTGPRVDRPWSVSALEVYLACPFKFFAQHILKLEEEPEDAEVMDPRQQGQFVHKVFEVFFSQWHQSGRGSITAESLEDARAMFVAVVENELLRLPEAEAGLERTRLLGSPAAAGLGEAVMRMEAERPQAVVERLLEHRLEGPVTLMTANGPRVIALRGKADRIDLLDDGTFRVIDYKLGWPPQRSRALQLPIYGLAAEQNLAGHRGRRWTLGEAAYLAFKGPKRVVPLFSAKSDRETVLGDAQQRVADTVDAIARGEFPPRPDDVFLCETCSFAAVCRKDYIGDV